MNLRLLFLPFLSQTKWGRKDDSFVHNFSVLLRRKRRRFRVIFPLHLHMHCYKNLTDFNHLDSYFIHTNHHHHQKIVQNHCSSMRHSKGSSFTNIFKQKFIRSSALGQKRMLAFGSSDFKAPRIQNENSYELGDGIRPQIF